MEGTATPPILEIEDLRVDFSTFDGTARVLQGVDLTLERNEVVGLVGETGSGKSVTALSVLGLLPRPPSNIAGGDIRVEGRSVFRMGPAELQQLRARKVGMVFQDPDTNLSPVFTIEDQMVDACLCRTGHPQDVAMPFRRLSRGGREQRREARKLAVQLLTRVGLPDASRRIRSYPHELSGGMRQRVVIAMALAGDPDLLIADEPTTALDVSTQAQILALITGLVREFDLTVLLISHSLGIVAQLCDRVAVMYCGRIVEAGPVRDIFVHPAHPYTVGLLGAVPRTHSTRGSLEEIPGNIPNLFHPPSGCRFHERCAHAMPECSLEPPPAPVPLGGGHDVSCHLYDDGARPELTAGAAAR
jgi:peptide/nickel transport system ATP-binding protein